MEQVLIGVAALVVGALTMRGYAWFTRRLGDRMSGLDRETLTRLDAIERLSGREREEAIRDFNEWSKQRR